MYKVTFLILLSICLAPFSSATPYLQLDNHTPASFEDCCSSIWWQISEDPDFQFIIPNLDVQIPYTEIIQLSDLEETFLNPGQTYYFRVCGDHAPWSTATAFQVQKPGQLFSSNYENEDRVPLAIEKLSRYVYNPLVCNSLWNELKPYFLPIDHPLKARLDHLFKKNRVTLSEETFEKAGFGKPKKRRPDQIIIGSNPLFKKYIFKVYLDTQPVLNEWIYWVKRIEGARAIRACLKRHDYTHFTVPHKWIYPLPEEPSPPSDVMYHRKNFILIADKMDILKSKDNLKAFKNRMTPERLDELYTILTEEGLIDSVYPDNIPFTKNGQIAFIDTEHHHLSPVPYHKISQFLSPKMRQYWQSLIE